MPSATAGHGATPAASPMLGEQIAPASGAGRRTTRSGGGRSLPERARPADDPLARALGGGGGRPLPLGADLGPLVRPRRDRPPGPGQRCLPRRQSPPRGPRRDRGAAPQRSPLLGAPGAGA